MHSCTGGAAFTHQACRFLPAGQDVGQHKVQEAVELVLKNSKQTRECTEPSPTSAYGCGRCMHCLGQAFLWGVAMQPPVTVKLSNLDP